MCVCVFLNDSQKNFYILLKNCFAFKQFLYFLNAIKRVGFRQGIVQGEKYIIHPILEWLLRNKEDLKKRAYLAKFLVKVEVPIEILADGDVSTLFEQVKF